MCACDRSENVFTVLMADTFLSNVCTGLPKGTR